MSGASLQLPEGYSLKESTYINWTVWELCDADGQCVIVSRTPSGAVRSWDLANSGETSGP